eukprot:6704536-Prymnesium_polylepis.2
MNTEYGYEYGIRYIVHCGKKLLQPAARLRPPSQDAHDEARVVGLLRRASCKTRRASAANASAASVGSPSSGRSTASYFGSAAATFRSSCKCNTANGPDVASTALGGSLATAGCRAAAGFFFAFASGLKTSKYGSSGSARRSRSRLRSERAAPMTTATSGGESAFAVVRFSGTVKSTHGSTNVSLPALCARAAALTRSTKPAEPSAGRASGAAGTPFWRAGSTSPAPARTAHCSAANAASSARFPLALRAFFAPCGGCESGAGV